MYTISLGMEWLVVILLFLNVASVFLIRSHDRFWLPPVILWIFLFFAWVTISQTNNRIIQYKQVASAEHIRDNGPFNAYELEENQKESHSTNNTFIILLGIQSITALLFQFAGWKTTGRKYYRKSSYTFLFLSACFFIVLILF
jgi:hypothetical protein